MKSGLKRILSLAAAAVMMLGAVVCSGCGEKNEVTGVTMAQQEYVGSNVFEIPRFEGEGEDAAMLNAQLDQWASPWLSGWESVRNDDVYWYEVKSYPLCGERYKQVAITAIEYPNYGTDGDVFSLCYDAEEHKLLSLDDALALAGVSRETVEQRVGLLMIDYLSEGDLVIDISFPAFVFAGNELCVVARAFIENDLADEHDELYVYNTAQDALSDYTGDRLLPTGLCDRLDPPLHYERAE